MSKYMLKEDSPPFKKGAVIVGTPFGHHIKAPTSAGEVKVPTALVVRVADNTPIRKGGSAAAPSKKSAIPTSNPVTDKSLSPIMRTQQIGFVLVILVLIGAGLWYFKIRP